MDQKAESKRLEDLFRYLGIASSAIDNRQPGDRSGNDDFDQNGDTHQSYDPVLNALCQLGVFHLDCDRAFISLIDNENQYIVAEMTKNVSLYAQSRNTSFKMLCMGARPLDLLQGVCAGTFSIFTDETDKPPISTPNIYADKTRYIINDFALEPMYKDRPYVKHFPYMRWYAEVPIRSPSGYVLGTYALIDNKPRIGLREAEYDTINEIAASIMKHIELVKLRDDFSKASHLLGGLNLLAQDAREIPIIANPACTRSSSVNSLRSAMRTVNGPPIKTRPTERQPDQSTFTQVQLDNNVDAAEPPVGQHEKLSSVSITTNLANGLTEADSTARSTVASVNDANGAVKHEFTNNIPQAEVLIYDQLTHVKSDTRSIMDISSTLLRAAMNLDGVVFLDTTHADMVSSTSIATKGDLASGVASQASNYKGSDDYRSMVSKEANSHMIQAFQEAFAKTVGHSQGPKRDRNGPVNLPNRILISEHLLHSIIHQYPNGQVFNFPLESLSNGVGAQARFETDFATHQPRFHEPLNAKGHSSKFQPSMSPAAIRNALHLAVPEATCIIFMPLWNSQKNKWATGCIGWSTKPRRVFQEDDLAYFNVFGNATMAKLAQMELVATDQAKSDFISCISHELRSPLHGILGSVEFLREDARDEEQHAMIDMVESCGRTLLDTMNHVLDYSKIRSIYLQGHTVRSGLELADSGTQQNSVTQNFCLFDLSVLIEESVESLVAGNQHNSKKFRHGSSSQQQQQQSSFQSALKANSMPTLTKPVVILNIEGTTDWQVRSDRGIWRRCLLNVLGNALKYTETGFIEVKLQSCSRNMLQDPDHSTDGGKNVILTVSDTGRGIGKTYLENHLYRPFVQENALSSGTGLGLSIVKTLVEELNGEIDIQSQVGIGSQVQMSMPITFVTQASQTPRPLFMDRKANVCLLGNSISNTVKGLGQTDIVSDRAVALNNTLLTSLTQWLNVNVIQSQRVEGINADIFIVDEDHLYLLTKSDSDQGAIIRVPAGSDVIVLCTQHSIHDQTRHPKSSRIHYLPQPFGPGRLTALLSRNFERRKSGTLMTSVSIPQKVITDEKCSPRNTDSTLLPQPAVSDSQPAVIPRAQTQSTTRVLLVDDNEINLSLLVRLIGRLNLRYETAVDGAEAVEKYQAAASVATNGTAAFDYVFMDVSMPIMDGFAATRAIRKFESANSLPPTKIIAMTGLGGAKAQQEAAESGMNTFLTKPVQLKRIKALVMGDEGALTMN